MENTNFIGFNSKCFTLVGLGHFLSTTVKVLSYMVVILLIFMLFFFLVLEYTWLNLGRDICIYNFFSFYAIFY